MAFFPALVQVGPVPKTELWDLVGAGLRRFIDISTPAFGPDCKSWHKAEYIAVFVWCVISCMLFMSCR